MKDLGVDPINFPETGAYNLPHMRFQPYLIGIMVSFILQRVKDVTMSRKVNLMLWMISIISGLSVILGIYHSRVHGYSKIETSMYWGLAKLAWSLALGWVTFSCIKGYGGIIDSFLSSGVFLVLSRLSYMMYLLHYDIIEIFIYSLGFTYEISHILLVRTSEFTLHSTTTLPSVSFSCHT